MRGQCSTISESRTRRRSLPQALSRHIILLPPRDPSHSMAWDTLSAMQSGLVDLGNEHRGAAVPAEGDTTELAAGERGPLAAAAGLAPPPLAPGVVGNTDARARFCRHPGSVANFSRVIWAKIGWAVRVKEKGVVLCRPTHGTSRSIQCH